jgi:hypothetical protein
MSRGNEACSACLQRVCQVKVATSDQAEKVANSQLPQGSGDGFGNLHVRPVSDP